MSHNSKPCEAANPATCRYHGTVPTVDRFLKEREQAEPVDAKDVDVSGLKVEADTAAKALGLAGIAEPPAGFAEEWNARFSSLAVDDAQVLTPEQIVAKELGENFEIGRHRGGPDLMWKAKDEHFYEDWDEYDSSDLDEKGSPKNENYVERSPVDDWRYDDPNYEIVAVYYTRNGGGNRECWCSDSSEPGHTCTATIVEDLENHPNFVGSYDDSGDSTYATFGFRIPKTEENVKSFRRLKEASQLRSATIKKEAIEVGAEHPYTILPVNPENVEVINALTEKKRAIGREIADQNIPYGFASKEMKATLVESLELVQKGDVAGMDAKLKPIARRNYHNWQQFVGSDTNTSYSSLSRLGAQGAPDLEKKIKELEELDNKRSLLASLAQEGKLPKELGSVDDILSLMEDQSKNPDWKVKSYKEHKQKTVKGLKAAIKKIEKVQALQADSDALGERQKRLDSHGFRHWPSS